MAWLVIDNVLPGIDGRYDFPDFAFTNRELYRIKQMSGVRAGELIEALEANDTAAYVGVAAAILTRHNVTFEEQYLWDAKIGSVTIDLGDPDDADPPPQPLETGSGDEPKSSGTDSDKDGE